MTQQDANDILEQVLKLTRDAGIVCRHFPGNQIFNQVCQINFYAGDPQTEIGDISLYYKDKDDFNLYWHSQWFYQPVPEKGVYSGLYEHNAGETHQISEFLGDLINKGLPGEKRKRKELKKKQLREERETL